MIVYCYMYSNKNIKKVNKKFVVISAIIIAIVVTFITLEKTGVTTIFIKETETAVIDNGINLSPPTEEERSAGDLQKESIISQEKENIEKPSSSKDDVAVVIVDAAQYEEVVEVRAFASNVVEKGICTFTFSNAEYQIINTTPAIEDASTTPCMTLSINRAEFQSSGTWKLIVSYKNQSRSGSASSLVEIK